MQLPDHAIARLRRLACSHPGARVQFRLPDASDFYVSLAAGGGVGTVISHYGQTETPSLTLEMSIDTLDAILDDRFGARHAFLLGDIRYSGDRELAAALADHFPAQN